MFLQRLMWNADAFAVAADGIPDIVVFAVYIANACADAVGIVSPLLLVSLFLAIDRISSFHSLML